ncbi:MAG: conjugal transfer protein TraG N-terminal domain-containing protein [Caldisericum sp.]
MLYRLIISVLFFTFFFFFFTDSLFADYEVRVYGGFEAAWEAWKLISLIFSNNTYLALYFSIAALGLFIGVALTLFRAATGGVPFSIGAWAVPFLIGVVLFFAFVQRKDCVVIYDSVTNQQARQCDVPLGLAATAGVLSRIEDGVLDLLPPPIGGREELKYVKSGNFIVGEITPGMIVNGFPAYFKRSLNNYFSDCVLQVGVGLGYLSVQEMVDGGLSVQEIISRSSSGSAYTVIYSSNNDTVGSTMTCREAGNWILSNFNNVAFIDEALKSACQNAGYPPTLLTQCKAVLSAWVEDVFTHRAADLFSVISQLMLAKAATDVIGENDQTFMIKLATRNTMAGLIGLGAHASSWIPVIKTALTCIMLALTPILFLFLPTVISLRVVHFVIGAFVWLTLWGIADGIVHNFATYIASNWSYDLVPPNKNFGLASALYYPDYLIKTKALFGALRWTGLAIASVIVGSILRLSGTALAMLAQNIMSLPMGSGQAAGQQVLTNPAGARVDFAAPIRTMANAAIWGGGISSLIEGTSTMQGFNMASSAMSGNMMGQLASNFTGLHGLAGMSSLASGAATYQVGQTVGTAMAGTHFSPGEIAQAKYLSTVYSTSKELAYGNPVIAAQTGAFHGATTIGEAEARLKIAQTLFGSDKDLATLGKLLAEFEAKGQILTEEMANRLNNLFFGGKRVLESGMKVRKWGFDDKGNLAFLEVEEPIAHPIQLPGGRTVEAGKRIITANPSTGNYMTTFEGVIADPSGNKFHGSVVLDQQGNLVSANLLAGINEQIKNIQSFYGAMLNKDLISMLKEEINNLRKEGRTKEADELEGIVNHLSKFSPDATFLVQIEKDPKTGRLAHFSAQAGGDFKRFVFAGNKVYAETELALDPQKHPEDKKFLLELASAIEKFSPNVAKALREYANKGIPVQLAYQSTLDGTITSLTVNSGGHARTVDLRQLTKGSLTEIYNLIRRLSGRHTEVYHDSVRHHFGVNYDFGNDTLTVFIDGKPVILIDKYLDAFRGDAPNPMGRAVIDHIAKQMGGYGKIADAVKTGLMGKLEAGIDISRTFWGKLLGIKAGASIAYQREAIARLDANTVALVMQREYANIMRQNKSPQWKAERYTEFLNKIFEDFYGPVDKSKLKQLWDGVPDPNKSTYKEEQNKVPENLYQHISSVW